MTKRPTATTPVVTYFSAKDATRRTAYVSYVIDAAQDARMRGGVWTTGGRFIADAHIVRIDWA